MIQPIILAAGKGTRMRSEHPKTLYKIAGKPMLGHILDAMRGISACLPPIVVVGHGKEEIISYLGESCACVEQAELTGTATAVRTCLPHIPASADAVLVLYGDHPFITSETIRKLAGAYETAHPVLVQSVITVPDFEGDWEPFKAFGRLVRDAEGSVVRVVEYKNATPEERLIREVNTGICVLEAAWLREAMPKIVKNPLTGEFYLTDLPALASEGGKTIVTVEVTRQDALGVNSPEDAAHAASLLNI